MIAQRRRQQHDAGHIDGKGQRHHVAHVAAASRTDKYPVQHEGRTGNHRQPHQIGQIDPRLCPHLGRSGHQIHDIPPRQREAQGHRRRSRQPPARGQHRSTAQMRGITTAKGLAHQRLRRKGKAIQRIGRDHQELQQHLIGGQRHITLRSAHEHKAHENRLQQQRADQDIGVDCHHPPPARSVEYGAPRAPRGACKGRAAEPQAQRKAAPFRQKGREGHALHAPAQSDHKPQIQRDVQPVHPQLQHQHRARALLRDQPAGDPVECDGSRSRPDPHDHIFPRERLHLGAGGRDTEGDPEKCGLQRDDGHARPQPDHQRAGQQCRNLAGIALTVRLRSQAHCAHAQKSKNPVER